MARVFENLVAYVVQIIPGGIVGDTGSVIPLFPLGLGLGLVALVQGLDWYAVAHAYRPVALALPEQALPAPSVTHPTIRSVRWLTSLPAG